MANQDPAQRLVVQACLVAALSYLAARLGGALIFRPQMVSPLWLGNVLLASVLLLVRRRIWPVLLAAGLAGFLLYDLQAGGPIRSIVWLILSNAVEILTAVLCLSSSFDGVPRLNSVKALAKYSFYAVFLAPFVGAFLGALSASEHYWASWKLAFFSEALGFLTLMPAVLGLAKEIPTWAQKPRVYYLEATALLVALIIFGNLAFASSVKSTTPAVLYSLVPLLLWSTLRFGSTGVSTSMIAIAFVSIWGAVHDRGPFTGPGPLTNVLSLQLFLLFAAAPFMVLAALVEERQQGEQTLRVSEERLRVATEVGRMYAWEWNPTTDSVLRSAECAGILGLDAAAESSAKDYFSLIHPDDRARLWSLVKSLIPEGPVYRTEYRRYQPDGALLWLEESGCAIFDGNGKMIRLVGMTADITERKRMEEALAGVTSRLLDAQEQERARIGRELHDDIVQRLVLLNIGLEGFQLNYPDMPTEAFGRMFEFQEQMAEIVDDIQSLSRELHSSKLEILGMDAAMKAFCKEFGKHQKVEIDFETHDLPSPVPPTIAVCLFRVLQEALHNSLKHSGARHFEVRSWGTKNEIHLTVSDSGAGFELESARNGPGLGLTSMGERLKLLKGTFSIKSQPKRGTTIHAKVPLSSGDHSMRTAG